MQTAGQQDQQDQLVSSEIGLDKFFFLFKAIDLGSAFFQLKPPVHFQDLLAPVGLVQAIGIRQRTVEERSCTLCISEKCTHCSFGISLFSGAFHSRWRESPFYSAPPETKKPPCLVPLWHRDCQIEQRTHHSPQIAVLSSELERLAQILF